MPKLIHRIEGIPTNPAISVSFHDIDPFFGKFEVLSLGVEVIASQQAVPTLAN